MLAKQLKDVLAQVDDGVELEIVSGFHILNLAAVHTQGELLDYLVRPHQMEPRLTTEQRREYVKQNAKVVEWIENPLWHNSLFLVATAPETINERP